MGNGRTRPSLLDVQRHSHPGRGADGHQPRRGIEDIEATRRLLATHLDIQVIGLPLHVDPVIADAMRAVSAAVCLSKDRQPKDVIDGFVGSPSHSSPRPYCNDQKLVLFGQR